MSTTNGPTGPTGPTDPAEPTGPVRRIGRYTIDGVIGTGAFATVYRATDERLDATVAIKLLADNHCLDPDIRARFVDEGRALRRVDSPHVLRIYDIGETEQLQPYLVVEHADRGTLAQRVARLRESGWRPGIDDLRALVADLAAAVDAVHAANLVHRDLSPGNVLFRSTGASEADVGRPATRLVSPDERLVVADLGLAKDLARSSGLTVAGGTEGFRPPEQRGTPASVDGRADLWALSAVLFWLVTGHAPATGTGRIDSRPIDEELTQALTELGLPVALRDPLVTSLTDDPTQRHPDVTTWRDAVEDALRPLPAHAPGVGTGRPAANGQPGPVAPMPPDQTQVASGSGAGPRSGDEAPARVPPLSPSDQAQFMPGSPTGAPPGREADGLAVPATPSVMAHGGRDAGTGWAPGGTGHRRSGWRRVVVAGALVLVGAVVGAALADRWGSDGEDGGITTRRLDDGRIEVSDAAGDARLAIVGPGEATVGDTVTFEAQAEGVDQWAWLMPDGTVYADALTTQLRPRSTGTAEVTLVGVAESGERLEVVHALRLVGG